MSKILLMIDHPEDRKLVSDILSSRYELLIPDKLDDKQTGFDLCILDKPAFKRLFKWIEQSKQNDCPAFLPFLLLLSANEISEMAPYLQKVVDELVVKPIKPVELQLRVELLLQTRLFSQESENWFRTTLYCIGDGVITTDTSGKVLQMNAVAEKLTGWRESEARGRPLEDVFQIVNEQTRTKMDNPVKKILKEGNVVGLANHTLLISRDGSEYPIADSGAPILGPKNEIVGCVLVFRNQMAEREAQKEIQKARSFAEAIVDALKEALLVLDGQRCVVSANRSFFKIFKLSEEEVIGKSIFQVADGLFNLPDLRRLLEKTSPQFENLKITADFKQLGQRTFLFNAHQIQSAQNGTQLILLTMEDISEKSKIESALRESEEKYRIVVENSPAGILIVGSDFKFIYVNNKMCEILGRKPEEVIGHDFREFLTKDSVKLVAERYQKRQRGEAVPPNYEFKVINKDGQERIVEIHAAIIKDSKGEIVTIGQILDITDRKKSEEALRQSEEKYRMIVEHAHDGIEISQNDRIMFCNARFAEMLGYSMDEIINIPFTKIYSEQAIQDLYQREKLRAKGVSLPNNYETTFRKKDGSLINVEVSYEIIDYLGRPATFAIIRDITEQKRAQAEHERLMTAIEQTNETVVITDLKGQIQYVNPAFEKITGYSKKEALGKNPAILKSGKHDRAFYQNLWETILAGKIWHGRIINKRKNGELFTEDKMISPVKDSHGKITNFVAVGRDVTQQLLLEQQFLQAQKMESIGRLAGGVAHDYNNMLTVILGNAQLGMSKLDEDNRLYDYFFKIHQAAMRSADITKQLLAFARKQTIEPRVLDLNETIENMFKMLRRLIGEEIDLAWLPGSALWSVKMDPSQIDQILMNLVVNARDAIGGVGKITIETENRLLDDEYCKTRAGFKPGEYVMVAVSDNGCGMEKEILDKIFEPFFTTKEMGKGTGLGLATVYGIVKQNHGFINVYSEPGKGTTFKIYIPRHIGQEKPMTEKGKMELPGGKGEAVLIVEDDKAILEFTQKLLENLGYKVTAVSDASKALQLVTQANQSFDLVLTDVIMPEISGKELTDRLKNILPDIKILFMSGYTANAIAHHGVLDDGINYIQKPFTVHDLAAKIRKVLESGSSK